MSDTLFFIIVKLAGDEFYSLSNYVIALMGLVWGWIIFGELHGAGFWFAVICILSGVTLANLRQHQFQRDQTDFMRADKEISQVRLK